MAASPTPFGSGLGWVARVWGTLGFSKFRDLHENIRHPGLQVQSSTFKGSITRNLGRYSKFVL
jgi:hypothetical protein